MPWLSPHLDRVMLVYVEVYLFGFLPHIEFFVQASWLTSVSAQLLICSALSIANCSEMLRISSQTEAGKFFPICTSGEKTVCLKLSQRDWKMWINILQVQMRMWQRTNLRNTGLKREQEHRQKKFWLQNALMFSFPFLFWWCNQPHHLHLSLTWSISSVPFYLQIVKEDDFSHNVTELACGWHNTKIFADACRSLIRKLTRKRLFWQQLAFCGQFGFVCSGTLMNIFGETHFQSDFLKLAWNHLSPLRPGQVGPPRRKCRLQILCHKAKQNSAVHHQWVVHNQLEIFELWDFCLKFLFLFSFWESWKFFLHNSRS